MKKQIYKYFIMKDDTSKEDILDRVVNGEGFNTENEAEKWLKDTVEESKRIVELGEKYPLLRDPLYGSHKVIYHQFKDARIIAAEITIDIGINKTANLTSEKE